MNVSLRRYKKDFQHSYTLGVYPTIELLQHKPGQTLGVLLNSKGRHNRGVHKIRSLCRKHDIPVTADDNAVNRISHRGDTYAIGVFRKFEQKPDPSTNHVVLVHPSGMGNLGTVMRAMIGYNIHDLAIIAPAADHFNPKVVRASMGALFQLRVTPFGDFESYQSGYSRTCYPLLTDGEHPLPEVDFQTPFSLVFGNESSGLSPEFHQLGTGIHIPHSGAIDSLNLALSVGITLYQAHISTKHTRKPA